MADHAECRPTDTQAVPQAKSVTYRVCRHGSLYLDLLDANGAVFATACLAVNSAAQFLDEATSDFLDVVDVPHAEPAGPKPH